MAATQGGGIFILAKLLPVLQTMLLRTFFTTIIFAPLISADFFPSTTVTGDVPVVTSSEFSFDGPMVGAANGSSFDWWYFDAVSQDGTTGATIIFLRTIIFGVSDSVDAVQVTLRSDDIGLDDTFSANSSSVSTSGFGASGSWEDVGSFEGSPSLSDYTVEINTDSIQGKMSLRSIAPAHYPDGNPPDTDASVLVAPALYWTNAIPGAMADCDFTVMGKRLQIVNGVGYHDKNWGGLNLIETVTSWYWGHATVGPYTLVWFETLSALTDDRYSSMYLVRDNEIELAGQTTPFAESSDFTIVVPFGNNTQYPPTNTSNLPSGFLVEFVGSEGRQWSFLLESVHIVSNSQIGFYTRWIGQVSGGEVGGAQYCGSGVWEWLRFI